jgi:hypothetical protein
LLEKHPVGGAVNDVRNEGEELIEPAVARLAVVTAPVVTPSNEQLCFY